MRRTVLIACLLALLVVATKQDITRNCSEIEDGFGRSLKCSTCVEVTDVYTDRHYLFSWCSKCSSGLVPNSKAFYHSQAWPSNDYDVGAESCIEKVLKAGQRSPLQSGF